MPDTIRCSACGALNLYTGNSCERCRASLSDERNAAYAARRDAGLYDAPTPAPPASTPNPGYLAAPAAEAGDQDGLPDKPATLRPDPFFGPIRRRTTLYRLSSLAIEVQQGLFGTRLDRVETYRIGLRSGDIDLRASLVQKFLKHTADLIIHTDDPVTPVIVLHDIHDAEDWKDRLGRSARNEQRARSPLNISAGFGSAEYPGHE